jgi:hypothetical protein
MEAKTEQQGPTDGGLLLRPRFQCCSDGPPRGGVAIPSLSPSSAPLCVRGHCGDATSGGPVAAWRRTSITPDTKEARATPFFHRGWRHPLRAEKLHPSPLGDE